MWTLVPASLSAAAALAILRYRLYDIDRIINRTLVYGLLTAVLGLGYAATVLALGQLFGGVGERTPSWAVAGACGCQKVGRGVLSCGFVGEAIRPR